MVEGAGGAGTWASQGQKSEGFLSVQQREPRDILVGAGRSPKKIRAFSASMPVEHLLVEGSDSVCVFVFVCVCVPLC